MEVVAQNIQILGRFTKGAGSAAGVEETASVGHEQGAPVGEPAAGADLPDLPPEADSGEAPF